MRLDDIKARAEAATEGPWWNESGVIHVAIGGGRASHPAACPSGGLRPDMTDEELQQAEDDAEFIAHAREDIPWLVERLEQAREARAIAQWVQTDMAYKAPEQLIERVGLWQAKLAAALDALEGE